MATKAIAEFAASKPCSWLHGTATDRVLRLLDAIGSYGPPRVALERAVYFTDSFKATGFSRSLSNTTSHT